MFIDVYGRYVDFLLMCVNKQTNIIGASPILDGHHLGPCLLGSTILQNNIDMENNNHF
jgi:hypothetical protein